MSLRGNLEALGLEELLRADLASQGSGRLTLRNGAHYAALEVSPDGVRVLHPDLLDAEVILQTFVDRGIVDAGRLAKRRRSHLADVLLLDTLVQEGAIPEGELMEVLAGEVEDTILDLMLWETGRFQFERGRIEPGERGLLGRICVDPIGVCERARLRMEERHAVGDRLGDNALLFFPVAGELPPLDGDGDLRHAVYMRLDGRIVAHEIALQLGVGRFEVLRTITRLAGDRLLRPAMPEELAEQATERAEAGDHRVARALVLQWAELHPDEEGPLHKLAALAVTGRDKQAEIEALCTLGHQFLQKGEVREAVEVFQRAMRDAGADEVVLAGLKLAAEAAGDNDSLVEGSLVVAQTRVDEGDPEGALELLAPLMVSHADNMSVQLLRARALVNLEKRAELLEQAELVGQVLGRDGCQNQVDREAVAFFREAIQNVAPDRGDLLERFRTLYDPRRARRRRMAITFAMLLLVTSAGIYLWPASAASLLAQAKEAADEGDKERASMLLGELTDRFPDSPEIDEATLLQNRLFPPHNQVPRRVQAERDLKKEIAGRLPALRKALPKLPGPEAQKEVRLLLELMEGGSAKRVRAGAIGSASDDVRVACARLLNEIVVRVKLLAQTSGIHERLRRDPEGLRGFLKRAASHRDAVWLANVKSTAELLHRLGARNGGSELVESTRDLGRGVVSLEKAAAFYDQHVPAVRLTLATLEIEEADRACREEAPRLMVGGGLEQADALYSKLEVLLEKYSQDETYRDLIETLNRRQIPKFIKDRRAQIADIRARLQEAEEAEERGRLDEAVRLYANLIKKYWLIRFENVFSLPLKVESVPPGAQVFVDDKAVGPSPAIVRYTWGSDSAVRVAARGWSPRSQALRTAEAVPPHRLELRLTPAPAWKVPIPKRGIVGVVRVEQDILRVDRGGRIVLHDGRTGAEIWTTDVRSLEGVRGRPAYVGGRVYVPRVDGHVLVLDPKKDGLLKNTIPAPRPAGDMAGQGELAAMATVDGSVLVFRNGGESFRVSAGAVPTAGLVGAHGAFWMGTSEGTVVRIGSSRDSVQTISIAGSNVTVAGLLRTPRGVLATTANGDLVSLAPDGAIRWKKEEVGDLLGPAARTKDLVAVVDRSGHVSLFDPDTGDPRGSVDMGKGVSHGLLGAGDILLAGCKDGRLWAYDVAAKKTVVDTAMEANPAVPPVLVTRDRIALGLGMDGCCLAVISVPSLP